MGISAEDLEAEPAELDCPPRYGTRRRPERPNLLGVARAIAWVLGKPLMPWQEHVVSVVTEYDPDTGRPFYRFVWITIPRQSGKTYLLLILILVRAVAWGRACRIVYTAQSGQDARKMLLETWKPLLQASAAFWGKVNAPKPVAGGLVTKLREQNGSEGLDFLNNSALRLQASGKSSGHGDTLDLGIIDEAMHDKDYRREQSMVPAINTVDDAQIIGASTAGTADSVLLNARVKAGRQAVVDDTGAGLAFFEWSAPVGIDLYDESRYAEYMPALGHTTTIENVREAIKLIASDPDQGEDEARRAYQNIPTSGTRTVFPPRCVGARHDHGRPARRRAHPRRRHAPRAQRRLHRCCRRGSRHRAHRSP